jgi:hypothetical protein
VDTSKIRPEIPGKFSNAMLRRKEKIRCTGHVGNKVLRNQRAEKYPTYNKKKEANCIGHSWHRNDLLKQIIQSKIEVTERRRRRRKQLLDNLAERENTGNSKRSTISHAAENSLWKRLWICR